MTLTGEILSYKLETADILRGRVADTPPLSVCCLLSFVFTYKGEEEKARGWGNPAEIITSYIYYMERIGKKWKQGRTAEAWEYRRRIYKKSIKKVLTKASKCGIMEA